MEPWARFGKRVRGISLTAKKSTGADFRSHAKRKKQKTDKISLDLASITPMSLTIDIRSFFRRIFRNQTR